MTAITTKSTKAELLQALETANQELDVLRDAYYTAQPITTNQLQLTASTIFAELKALCVDVYKAGAWCRKASQPVLDNLRMIVNN